MNLDTTSIDMAENDAEVDVPAESAATTPNRPPATESTNPERKIRRVDFERYNDLRETLSSLRECKQIRSSTFREAVDVRQENGERRCRLKIYDDEMPWSVCSDEREWFRVLKQRCHGSMLTICQDFEQTPSLKQVIEIDSDAMPPRCRLAHWPEGKVDECEQLQAQIHELTEICRKVLERENRVSAACDESSIVRYEESVGDFMIAWCHLESWDENLWVRCQQLDIACAENPRAGVEEITTILQASIQEKEFD